MDYETHVTYMFSNMPIKPTLENVKIYSQN